MFFNPLFIQAMSGADTGLQKTQKIGNSSYLFSDIMNVQIQKGEGLSEAGKVLDGISLKDLEKLSDLSNLSDLSEEEALDILSQLLAQFGISGNIIAQITPVDGTEALSGSLTVDGETAVLDLGSNIETAALKIMDLLKQSKDVTLQLADGNDSFLLKLKAQENLQKKELISMQENSKFTKELTPLQKNSKFTLEIEKNIINESLNTGKKDLTESANKVEKNTSDLSKTTIETMRTAQAANIVKEEKTENVLNKGAWTVEKSVEMLKALKPQKTANSESGKNPQANQEMAAERNISELNVPVEKKEKTKADKRAANVGSTGSSKEAEKTNTVGKSVSHKNDKSDFAQDLKKEEANLTSSLKSENAKPQESKASEGFKVSDKDFSQHILTGDKELKVDAQSALKNTGAAAPQVRTVRIAEVMNEITQFIKQADKQSVVLKIEPEHLGKVSISLEISNASLDAKIQVENEQVKAIVESSAKQLTQSLVQNGIQLNSLTVSLSGSEQKLGKQPSFNNKRKGSGARGDAEIEIEKTEVKDINKKLGYNTYEYLA